MHHAWGDSCKGDLNKRVPSKGVAWVELIPGIVGPSFPPGPRSHAQPCIQKAVIEGNKVLPLCRRGVLSQSHLCLVKELEM